MSNGGRKSEKVKDFLKKHKTTIALCLSAGATIIFGGAIFIAAGKRHKQLAKEGERIFEILQANPSGLPGTMKKSVDEDIFLMLAPAIEEAVLNKSLEKVVLDRSYDLGDNLHKLVSVSIENVFGD